METAFIMEGKKRRSAILVRCSHCGIEFLKREDHALKATVHYCTQECWNEEQKSKLQSVTSRVCVACGIPKPLDEFYDRKDRHGKRSKCKACRTAQTTIRTQEDRKLDIPRHNRIRWVCSIRMKYGVEPEEYERLLAEQKGVCAICKQPETRKLRGNIARLSVDHNHLSGRIRGLLCSKCNTAIGLINEDMELLERIRQYLSAENNLTFPLAKGAELEVDSESCAEDV